MYIVRTCWRIVLLALFGITPFVVSADIVIYTSGTGNAGQTGEFTQSYTLRDATLTFRSPTAAWGGGHDVQVGGIDTFSIGPDNMVLSFDDLFSGEQGRKIGNDGNNINSANLFMFQNGGVGSGTLTVSGLSAGASDWNEATATWNTKDGTTGWDGAGGDIDTALSGNYGSYNFSDTDSGWVSIDITDALKAYAEGTIGGIVLTTDAQDFFDIPFFSADSKDNPSGNSAVLRVDQIPEPAVASFMLIGSAYMLVNRRMRQRIEAENQTASL